MLSRRQLLLIGSAVAIVPAAAVAGRYIAIAGQEAPEGDFEITRTPEQWREMLTENEYLILREEKTERAYTSDLLKEKREGNYTCAGCDLAVYSSETKFDSKTGWPSFYEALPDAVRTKPDNTLLTPRTEVHCRRCGGHLGHIFDDGPPPTGKRHCINGIALDFVPADGGATG